MTRTPADLHPSTGPYTDCGDYDGETIIRRYWLFANRNKLALVN